MGGGRDYVCDLLPNVHENLPVPQGAKEIECVKGDYLYYHYGCDGFDDRVCIYLNYFIYLNIGLNTFG